MDRDNPLYKNILKVWLPNNIRHNIVMLCFVLLYFVIQYKANYWLMAEIYGYDFDLSIFTIPEVKLVHEFTISSFLFLFDLYWIQRVLRKVKISRNMFLQLDGIIKLSKEMETYYEKKDKASI